MTFFDMRTLLHAEAGGGEPIPLSVFRPRGQAAIGAISPDAAAAMHELDELLQIHRLHEDELHDGFQAGVLHAFREVRSTADDDYGQRRVVIADVARDLDAVG